MTINEFMRLGSTAREDWLDDVFSRGAEEELTALMMSAETARQLGAVEDAVQERKIRRARAAIRQRRADVLAAGLPATWSDADPDAPPAPKASASENDAVRERVRAAYDRAREAFEAARLAFRGRP